MKFVCRGCSFKPSCQTKKEIRDRHGLPSDFREGLRNAYADGFITLEEADAGFKQYLEDYSAAPPE